MGVRRRLAPPERDGCRRRRVRPRALLARIEHAVQQVGAGRVVDGLARRRLRAARTTQPHPPRAVPHRSALRDMGVTAIITAERTMNTAPIAVRRRGVRRRQRRHPAQLLEDEKRRRTVEILKFRGTAHQKGECPFTIVPSEGIVVMPLSAMELKQKIGAAASPPAARSWTQMCGGGFFRDSIILVSGRDRHGQDAAPYRVPRRRAAAGERCLLFAFEESREQLFRNATGWGIDFAGMEREGKLRVVCEYPEAAGLEDHLMRMKKADRGVQARPRGRGQPVGARARVDAVKRFREFVHRPDLVHEAPGDRRPLHVDDADAAGRHVDHRDAHLHDHRLDHPAALRRDVGEMRRGLTVLKMRGSRHDKDIREFTIDSRGMHIGEPFRDMAGILVGKPGRQIDRLGTETPGQAVFCGRRFVVTAAGEPLTGEIGERQAKVTSANFSGVRRCEEGCKGRRPHAIRGKLCVSSFFSIFPSSTPAAFAR